MWEYMKKLQYPINIKKGDPRLATFVISQYGGPDGELGASLRYLSQRYSMDDPVCKALLTDIGILSREMLPYQGKREFWGFLIYGLTTRNRIKKYAGTSDKPEVEAGGTERVVNIFAV